MNIVAVSGVVGVVGVGGGKVVVCCWGCHCLMRVLLLFAVSGMAGLGDLTLASYRTAGAINNSNNANNNNNANNSKTAATLFL